MKKMQKAGIKKKESEIEIKKKKQMLNETYVEIK